MASVTDIDDLDYAGEPQPGVTDSLTIGTMTILTGDSGGKSTGDR